MPALIRVGHKGADAIVPGNTLASFDAALAAGVDMIELDVIAERRDGAGELLVAHDHRALAERGAPTLEQALAHLRGERFAAVRLQLDVKRRGYEQRLVAALERAGMIERSFITGEERRSLALVRAAAPALRIGWTLPDRFGLSKTPALAATVGAIQRALLPRRVLAPLRGGSIDAVVAEWPLITATLVAAVTAAGGELYAWTVDDAEVIRRLAALGVSGVITNDPRLFATLS